MISLTIEAESAAQFGAELKRLMAFVSNPAPSVEKEVATPEPVTEPKKRRDRPAKKTETIEATAEEAKPAVELEKETEAANDAAALVTRDAVKDAAYRYMEAKMALDPDDKNAGRAAFQELLDEFEIPRFSQLPADKFAAAIAWANTKTDGVEAADG